MGKRTVPLIESKRHSKADLTCWDRLIRYDAVMSKSHRLEELSDKAMSSILEFVERGTCYVGVSWGKDSVVVAHMAVQLGLPLVWVRVEPITNPDCFLVRDVFLRRYSDAVYNEIEVWCRKDEHGWHATGTLEEGFKIAAGVHGARHVSGVRGDESNVRKMRMMRWGISSENTCAPIGWWSGEDVFAYLHLHDLPIHSAYAMSFGGTLDRNRIRVASLGGERGTGVGRSDWERRYYRDAFRKMEAL